MSPDPSPTAASRAPREHDPRLCLAGIITGLWIALLLVAGFAALGWWLS